MFNTPNYCTWFSIGCKIHELGAMSISYWPYLRFRMVNMPNMGSHSTNHLRDWFLVNLNNPHSTSSGVTLQVPLGCPHMSICLAKEEPPPGHRPSGSRSHLSHAWKAWGPANGTARPGVFLDEGSSSSNSDLMLIMGVSIVMGVPQ